MPQKPPQSDKSSQKIARNLIYPVEMKEKEYNEDERNTHLDTNRGEGEKDVRTKYKSQHTKQDKVTIKRPLSQTIKKNAS